MAAISYSWALKEAVQDIIDAHAVQPLVVAEFKTMAPTATTTQLSNLENLPLAAQIQFAEYQALLSVQLSSVNLLFLTGNSNWCNFGSFTGISCWRRMTRDTLETRL